MNSPVSLFIGDDFGAIVSIDGDAAIRRAHVDPNCKVGGHLSIEHASLLKHFDNVDRESYQSGQR